MRIVFVLLLLMLNACTTTGGRHTDASGDEIFGQGAGGQNIDDQPVETIPAPVETQVFYIKPVVKRLLKKAGKKFDERDYHATVVLLEQAIDISPNNPFVWQRLAMVRLKQQNYSQAEQLAIKSNVLGEANDNLRMMNWKIIAEAKRAQLNGEWVK